MRMFATLLLAGAALGGCATSGDAPMVEQGYQRGALGVAAIGRGDWAAAEVLLMERRGVGENDPARLINLGKVYMETGRPGAALSAWRLALGAQSHFMVETVDGRIVSTRDLAGEAIARYEQAHRTAAR